MSCPNRDGSLSRGGCIFCSEGGSGDFAQEIRWHTDPEGECVLDDLEKAFTAAKDRVKAKSRSDRYIAYFQAYTNTYEAPSVLRALYTAVAARADVAAISVATRPDCLSDAVLKVLYEVNQIKPVWVELGLQSCNPQSLVRINSHITPGQYLDAVEKLTGMGICTITHLILGLPWESREQMLESVRFVARTKSRGIKLHLLHYLKNTALGDAYRKDPGAYPVMSEEEYISLVADCIALLPPDMVIHRMTGDGPKDLLLAPRWSGNKKQVLNGIRKELARRKMRQGDGGGVSFCPKTDEKNLFKK